METILTQYRRLLGRDVTSFGRQAPDIYREARRRQQVDLKLQ